MTNRLVRAGIPAIALLVAATVTGPALASGPVPYTDPAVTGSLALCDGHGRQITSGSIATQPFASLAVASSAAPGGYAGKGRGAVLYAYQPIQNVPASAWSGEELTDNSRYTDPAHPMTAATGGDPALQNFLTDYAPMWDGFVQLRLYTTAPGHPMNSTSYPALDLKITGSSWQAVDAATVSCTAGRAVSVETTLLPKSALRTPVAHAAPAASADRSEQDAIWVPTVVGALLALAVGGYLRRRVKARPSAPPAHPDRQPRPALHGTFEKGRRP